MNFECCAFCDRGHRPSNCYRRDGWDWPHGEKDDIAEPITERLAVLPDGVFLRRNPPEQPSVEDILQTGSLIRASYHHDGRVYKVFRVTEREYYGTVPAYSLALGDPETPARQDGLPKNYSGANIKELVYQDGAIRKLFWNNTDTIEVLGYDAIESDYQATISEGWSA